MTAPEIQRDAEEEQQERAEVVVIEEPEAPPPRAGLVQRAGGLLRLAVIGLPFLLFTAAILASLPYWYTLEPLYGWIAIGLTAAGVLAAIAAAFLVPKE